MKRTTAHLFPSSANLLGFFPDKALGFAGLIGFLPVGGLPGALVPPTFSGTTLLALNSGFLCVI